MNSTVPSRERPQLAACPLCAHRRLDYQFRHAGTPVVSCAGCGLLMRNPQPSDAELIEASSPRVVAPPDLDFLRSRFDILQAGSATPAILCVGPDLEEFAKIAASRG